MSRGKQYQVQVIPEHFSIHLGRKPSHVEACRSITKHFERDGYEVDTNVEYKLGELDVVVNYTEDYIAILEFKENSHEKSLEKSLGQLVRAYWYFTSFGYKVDLYQVFGKKNGVYGNKLVA